MMCQCRFIDCYKCTTLAGDVDNRTGYACVEQMSYGKSLDKVMLKILQARLQQYVNCELPDVQAGFRKGRGTKQKTAYAMCVGDWSSDVCSSDLSNAQNSPSQASTIREL